MKFDKKNSIFILALIFLLLVSLSAVSASKITNETVYSVNDDILSVNVENNNFIESNQLSDDILSYTHGDKFIGNDGKSDTINVNDNSGTCDPMYIAQSGVVSGSADLIAINPWLKSGSLQYTIPDDVKEIKSAMVIVTSYSGSGNSETYALHSDVTLTTTSIRTLGSENLTFTGSQTNDPTVYVINNHTTKQYSDYQYTYDILSDISSLVPGSKITVNVTNSKYQNYGFDGRIKLIGLFIAYDDYDDDELTYWLDIGQQWTQSESTIIINTADYTGDAKSLTFKSIALSTNLAYNYQFNGLPVDDPDYEDGSYYKYLTWDLTDYFTTGQDTSFSYVADPNGWGSYKTNVILLTAMEEGSLDYSSVYVSPSGSNSNSGMDWKNAVKDIETAVSLVDADGTIYVDEGTTYTASGANGITINKNVNIEGKNSNVIIDADNAGRIFNIGAYNVCLTNLTLINGNLANSSEKRGGAIYATGSTLNINDCRFINNTAGSSGSYGGAICSYNTVNIDKCTFYNNYCRNGASINQYDGDLTITNSVLLDGSNSVKIKDSSLSSSSVENCWWGNNDTTKYDNPKDLGYTNDDVSSYLILNTTVSSTDLSAGDSANIILDLTKNQNGVVVSDIPDVPVLISSVKGNVNKNDTIIENGVLTFNYTVNEPGKGSVVVESYGQVISVVNFNNVYDVVIGASDVSMIYGEDKTLTATVKYGGKSVVVPVAISINGVSGDNVTSYGGKISLSDLNTWNAGSYTVNLTVNTDEYRGNKVVGVNIAKATPSFIVADFMDLFVGEYENIVITDVVSDVNPSFTYVSDDEAIATVVNGVVAAVGEGTIAVNVTLAESDNYNALSKNIIVNVSKIPTSISVEQENIFLDIGENQSVGASLNPVEAGELTYVSSNTAVAYIENGLIVANAEGNAVVTVSFAGDDMYAAAEDKTIDVSVALEPASVSASDIILNVNSSITIVPTTIPAGLEVEYYSANPNIAEVDVNGVVTSHKGGNTTITIKTKVDGIHIVNSTTINVTVNKLKSVINIENDEITLNVNDNVVTGASLEPEDLELTYVSSNPTVASVENALIVANAEGTAVVTVSFAGDDYYEAAEDKTINVIVSLNDASVSVNNSTLDLFVGDTFTIVVDTVPEGLNVTFTSRDKSVVTVDENGKVTAVGEGSAVVTVCVGGDGVYALNSTDVAVSVAKPKAGAVTTVKSEYTNVPSIYAGVVNNLTVTVKNDGASAENVLVKVLIGDELIGSQNIANYEGGQSYTFNVIDTTIRPVTENTINGNNNEKVNYTVVVQDSEGTLINETDSSFVVVYNGYLGKDYEYPKANPTLREFNFNGDVFVLTGGEYVSAGVTNRSDVFNVNLNEDIVSEALLYLSYNWDKAIGGDFNNWDAAFNDQIIVPIASYRDQGNLGNYASYGYGLVVYNVTDLIKDGENTFILDKTSGNAAVYPSNLIVLTDKINSFDEKIAYIMEEADLLSTSYNKNLPAGFNTAFDVVDKDAATLYVFAASAESGDGNLIVNGEIKTNIWNGSSNSLEKYVTDVDSGNIEIYFEATGGTILGLHQMVVVENNLLPKVEVASLKTIWSSGIFAGVDNNLTISVNNKESQALDNVIIEVYSNESDELIASYTIDSLTSGTSSIVINDPTIRDLTESTVWPDAQNNLIKYTVFVKYANQNIFNASFDKMVAYDGYLNKTYAYGGLSNKISRNYTITGDIIVASQPTDEYMDQFSRQRTETWNISVPEDSTLVKALLYFNYNWDTSFFPEGWTLTFNEHSIIDEYIFWDTDKGNLGMWGSYQYGTLVFDVSNYFVNGENTFNITKKGNCALYPSTLFVLYNTTGSNTIKDVYFADICDVLYNYYNMEYINKTNVYVPYNGINVINLINASLYVFAGSADGSDDGNISFNGKEFSHLWDENGTTTSCYAYVADVSDVIDENNDAWYLTDLEKMTTVVLYEQVLVVTRAAELIPTEITVDSTSLELTVGDNDTVNAVLTPDGVGDLTFTSSDESIVTVDSDGKLTAIAAGNANITVSFAGNDKYAAAENVTIAVTVDDKPIPKENLTISASADPITVGENATIVVSGLKDATGNVTVRAGNETYFAPIVDSVVAVIVPGLPVGNTTAIVTYAGDDKYNPIETEVTVSVKEDTPDIVSAPDVTKYYGGPERFVVTVTDYQGNPLANKTVIININGRDYTRTTNESGTASMAIGLPSNTYNVTVTVDNQTVKSVVTVLSTVNGTDVVKMYRNATQYYATFLDSEGKYLTDGTTVKFNINGVMYERKVSGDKGLARLNINLPAGEYTITAMNPITGENAANNITVLPTIVENKDITKYYKNATQYTVKVLGADGKLVGAGETVTFNINGVMYKRTTNESGIAKVNINLAPGDYIITAEYNGFTVSNNITVLPVLSAKDIKMKYRDGTKFVATLVGGQGKPYEKQTVQFNINGVFYNRVTDASGQAKLNINLLAGEYIITSSYNGANIANKITITA